MSAPRLAPPPCAPWPEPGHVAAWREPDARLVWLLHVAPSGRRWAVPLGFAAAQLLALEISDQARAALEGRTG